VAAIVNRKFIKLFNRWQRTLEEMGYTNFTQLLNSMDYGVPQSRLRCFMVSILDENARYYFPEPFPLKKRLKDVLEDDVDESYYLSDERVRGLIESTLKEKLAGRGFEFKPKTKEDIANTLTGSCVGRKTDNFLVCGAIRGRGKDNGADKNTQQLEVNSPDMSNTLTSVQKDNVLILGNSEQVANTVTAHYAKEKTSDLVRQSFGGGQLCNGEITPPTDKVIVNGCKGEVSRTIMAQHAKHKESGAVSGRHAETLIMERKSLPREVLEKTECTTSPTRL